MDFDKILETLIQTILSLLLGVFKAGYQFLTAPALLAKPAPDTSGNMPGPLTFFILSLILFAIELLLLRSMTKGTRVVVVISPSPEEWQKAIMKADPKPLLTVAAPFVALIAAHAGFVRMAFRVFGSNIPFRSIFSAGCYLAGTFFLLCAITAAVYILILPRRLPTLRLERHETPREPNPNKLWVIFSSVLSVIVFFKLAHSYFVFLSVFSATSIWLTIGLWLAGTTGFAIAIGVLLGWFWSAIFPESVEPEISDEVSESKSDELEDQVIRAPK